MQHTLVQVAVYLATLVCLGVETLQTCMLMIEGTTVPPSFSQFDLQRYVLVKLRLYIKGAEPACWGAVLA